MDIEANLATYLGAREPTARYTSFDYCFNYFRDVRAGESPDCLTDAGHLEASCLQLGFYLASWGMLRGSSTLLRRSVKHFAPAIEVVATAPSEIWELDADQYSAESWQLLRETAVRLRAAFPEGASDILVTKIMLGVFGCVPAFDTYFKKGFGVSTFGVRALERVGRFYRENSDVIERHRVPTLDFETGGPTDHVYTRAKVIDMVFFVEGGQ